MPEYSKRSRSADPNRAALEDIAHLTRKICATWGSPELDIFLSRLIMDARDGARQGLPVDVATEVLFLAQANKMVRAIDLGKKLCMDARAAYRIVDEEDQARLKIDALDDPTVSRDTVLTRGAHAMAAGPAAGHSTGSGVAAQAQGLGELLRMLFHSKWVMGAILLLVGVRFVWPMVKRLI